MLAFSNNQYRSLSFSKVHILHRSVIFFHGLLYFLLFQTWEAHLFSCALEAMSHRKKLSSRIYLQNFLFNPIRV